MVRMRLCVNHNANDLLSCCFIDIGMVLSIPVVAKFEVHDRLLALLITIEIYGMDVLVPIRKFVVLYFYPLDNLWAINFDIFSFPRFCILCLHHRCLEPVGEFHLDSSQEVESRMDLVGD